MKLRWVSKNLRPIAIDLGTDRIKLLQVTVDDPPRLAAIASAEIPLDVRCDAEQRDAFVLSKLRDLLREGGFAGKRGVLGLPAALTHVQHVRIAKTDDAELDTTVIEELRGKLPIDPSSLVIRNVNVGEVAADGAARQEVVSMAATRPSIMRLIGLLSKAGLTAVGMHCEPLAICQAFAHLSRRTEDVNTTTFFIDIGSSTTKALITHGKELVFAKTIRVAGDHFDRQLAKQRDVSLEESRRLRHEAAAHVPDPPQPPQDEPGLPDAAPGDRRGTGSPPGLAMMESAIAAEAEGPTTATAVAEPVNAVDGEMLDCLTDELQLCVGYHGAMFPDRSVDRLVFLGGEAEQRVMCQRIAQSLRLPAQVGDPLARVTRPSEGVKPIDVDLRRAQPGWAVPMGLCLLPTNL